MKSVFEDVLREVASDIIEESRNITPYKGGDLRASARTRSVGTLQREVTYGTEEVEYAGAQEAGQTRGYKIRNYSLAGTGAHFLEKTGDKYVKLKLVGKFKKHAVRVRP